MVYNPAAAAESLMLEADELKEILDLFFEDADSLLEQVMAALDAQNSKEIIRILHNLKGSAANLRFETIAGIAAKLETEAKQGNFEVIPSQLPGLQAEIRSAQEDVERYFHK